MERGVVVRGRLHGRQIELDEPVDQPDGEVELIVRPVAQSSSTVEDVFSFLRSVPVGTRTKAEIDRQLAEERDAWGERSSRCTDIGVIIVAT